MLVAAQPSAVGAGAEGAVEGEQARLDVRHPDAAVRTGVLLRHHKLVPVFRRDEDKPLRKAQGGLHGLRDAAPAVRRHLQAVDDHLDVVALPLIQRDVLLQPKDGAVHACTGVALLPHLAQEVSELALLPPDKGTQDLDAQALVLLKDVAHDLVDGMALHGLTAVGAVGDPHAAVEQAEVVVDLRHRADGGAGVVARALLLDGDGGGEAGDVVYIRLLLHAQKLPRVGGEGFHVTPLALGIERIESQGGFTGAGWPRDHDKLAARDVNTDVLEVVLPRA